MGNNASSTPLSTCLASTGVSLIYPNSTGYNITARPENVMYDYWPSVIAEPTSTSQVAAVVQCIAQQQGKTKLSTYGGGHGYAAYALGGADGFTVIDSSHMKNITIHTANRTATVGMGVDLGNLALQLGNQGFALPHGTCPTVGVGGHALGGGWGYSSRKWGWLQDHIIQLTFVDPTGTIRTISNSSTGSDLDIWWAMRGAGSNNFGVVTEFVFALETAPTKTVNYKMIFHNNNDCVNMLLAAQDIALKTTAQGGLPPEFGASTTFNGETGGVDVCDLTGQYLGSFNDFFKAQKLVNSTLIKYDVTNFTSTATEYPTWVAALTAMMGNLTSSTWFLQYYAESIVDDGAPGYNASNAKSVINAVQAAVNTEGINWAGFDLIGPGSATNAPPPHGPSALDGSGKRSALFLTQIFSFAFPGFDQPQAQAKGYVALDGIRNAIKGVKPGANWNAYVNYVDPRLKDWAVEYYGTSLPRLKSIKTQIDPNTIFDFPQGLAHA